MRSLLALALAVGGLVASAPVLANTPEGGDAPGAAKAPMTETRQAPAPAAGSGPAPAAPAGTSGAAVPASGGEATAEAPAKPAPKPSLPIVVANINLSTQRMTVTVNGKLLHTWAVSSGLPAYPTPRGRFTATWMSRMHYSKQYDDAPMPHSVFFKDGAAVHGTNATRQLGRPASHGCVRLAPGNAATFFSLVSRHGLTNTRVVVHGNLPPMRVASRERYEGDESYGERRRGDRGERRGSRRDRSWPGDSYAWSGSNRSSPSWARY